MAPLPLLVTLGVLIVGIVSHKAIVGNVDTPPLDFGGGSMFDFIAPRYDTINRILAFRMDVCWRKVMVNKIKAHLEENSIETPRILDLATGTADVALMLSNAIPSATVIGVDPSEGMLDVGRKKVSKKKKDGKISLQQADARSLSRYQANPFDTATMAFGIRNVPERDTVFCEVYKVLNPGALLCILEFSEPDKAAGPMGAAVRVFIQHVVPFIGGILSGRPTMYKHLQNSIKYFPTPEEFREDIERLNCSGAGQSFAVEELTHLNFRSVQIYSIRSMRPPEAVPPESRHVPRDVNEVNGAPIPKEAPPPKKPLGGDSEIEPVPEEAPPQQNPVPGDSELVRVEPVPEEVPPQHHPVPGDCIDEGATT